MSSTTTAELNKTTKIFAHQIAEVVPRSKTIAADTTAATTAEATAKAVSTATAASMKTTATSRESLTTALKMELSKLSERREDWRAWSMVRRAHARSLGCNRAFDAPKEEEVKRGNLDFTGEDINPQRLREAEVEWRSLIKTC